MVATDGNAKTTAAAAGNKKTGKKGSLNDGLSVAFATGAVMGFAVVGLGLTGVTICYMVLSSTIPDGFAAAKTMQCLAGFGFGASSIALFARVAGGIYTKAADVGVRSGTLRTKNARHAATALGGRVKSPLPDANVPPLLAAGRSGRQGRGRH